MQVKSLTISIIFLLAYGLSNAQYDMGYGTMPVGFTDINGDKKAEFVTFRGQPDEPEIWVYRSSSNEIFDIPIKSFKIDKGYDKMPRCFADINGDGKADYITFRGQQSDPEIWTYLSTGINFSTVPIKSLPIDRGFDHMPRCFADIDGDSKADYVTFRGQQDEPEIWTYLSNGNGFNGVPVKSAPIDKGYDHMPRCFVDINGDKKADYITFRGQQDKPEIWTYLSNGKGFNNIPIKSAPLDKGYDHMPRCFADVNGDGKADYITFRGQPGEPEIWTFLSTGNGFNSIPIKSSSIDKGYDFMPRCFSDINGDKRADYITFRGDPNKPEIWIYLSIGNGFDSKPIKGFNNLPIPPPPPTEDEGWFASLITGFFKFVGNVIYAAFDPKASSQSNYSAIFQQPRWTVDKSTENWVVTFQTNAKVRIHADKEFSPGVVKDYSPQEKLTIKLNQWAEVWIINPKGSGSVWSLMSDIDHR